MKEKLTLRNGLIALAFVFGIVAFFVAFGSGFKASYEGIVTEMTGLIIGTQKSAFAGITVELPKDEVVRPAVSLVGIILILVGSLVAFVMALLDKKCSKVVMLVAAAVVLAGAIMVFCVKDSYVNSSVAKTIKEMGVEVGADEKKEMISEMKEMLKEYKLNAATIVSGVFGALSSAAIAVGTFLKK